MVVHDFNKARMQKIIEEIAQGAGVSYETAAVLLSTSYLKGYRDGRRGDNVLVRQALVKIFDELT